MTLNNHIKHYRKAAGLKQKELASRLGVPASQICKLEQGLSHLTQEKALDIAQILKVHPAHLFDWSDKSDAGEIFPRLTPICTTLYTDIAFYFAAELEKRSITISSELFSQSVAHLYNADVERIDKTGERPEFSEEKLTALCNHLLSKL